MKTGSGDGTHITLKQTVRPGHTGFVERKDPKKRWAPSNLKSIPFYYCRLHVARDVCYGKLRVLPNNQFSVTPILRSQIPPELRRARLSEEDLQVNHPVTCGETPTEQRTYKDGFCCDVCWKQGIPKGTLMMGCRACDWDMCMDCRDRGIDQADCRNRFQGIIQL